jgi:FtsP/CotA-like multicopper oxidase with cupredoxin domain
MASRRFLLAASFCVACAPAPEAPAPREVLPELVPFVDTNPDPNVVEVSLVVTTGSVEYRPDRPAQVWGYRDGAVEGARVRVPGPLLEAKRGDLVIVHARNEMPTDGTSIHFHGIRLDADMDGAHHAMLPGKTWEQSFVAKDAGLFWYHPHIRADVQIERGLYGAVLVREAEAPRSRGDRILVLDDVKLGEDGDLAGAWTEEDILHGRQGNLLLVNGVPHPVVHATRGSRERWRIVNTSNGRIFDLDLDGLPFTVIGWDGGRIGEPYETRTLLVAPGERYDVLVDIPASAGDSIAVRTGAAHHDGSATEAREEVFSVAVEEGPPVDVAPAPVPVVEPLPVVSETPERLFVLEEDLEDPYGPFFTINQELWPFHTPIEGKLNDLEVWRVENDTNSAHPFHLHGMFFQVLDRDGAPEARLGWKDTVLVSAGSSLRFAVRYDAPGVWMYHCQIPEHAERGMMGDLIVGP